MLILGSSVNGGSSSVEAQQAAALGYTVTVASGSTWDSENFANYKAIIIGDPSGSSSCAGSVPTDALSTASAWGAAVKGNVAVLGTAPVLGGADTLIRDAISYAASGSGTGLYVSLNCEYSGASAGTPVPLLAGVDGGGFTVTGQAAACPAAAGSVNTWESVALSQFNGLTASDLGPWPSPACSVQETLNAWPSGLGGLGFFASASPASFTASDGQTGQAYIVAGPAASTPTTSNTSTAALSPTVGGALPAGASAGGSNPAVPAAGLGVDSRGVNTENGDYSLSASDLQIPGFGPPLGFSRTYDAQAARSQAWVGQPGPMGYGWTDTWGTSLRQSVPVPGDIYTIDGLATAGASGGATQTPLDYPQTTVYNSGNIYIADTAGNRVEEVPGTSGTQWGIAMTAGKM
ncbi:MAG: DUF6531 domain-containing protein [Streptosporangiaceae bacterium]